MSRYQKTAYESEQFKHEDEADDWDTDPDFVNDITEKEQRKGSALIQKEKEVVNIDNLREQVKEDHETNKAGEKHSSQVHKYGEQ